MRLRDKIALVTGAGFGIGRGIALRFAQEGATVVVNDLDADRAIETTRLITEAGGVAWPLVADVAQRASVERMVGEIIQRQGRIDILVNNAGILGAAPFLEMSDDEWNRMLAVDLTGPFIVSQVVAREMIGGGVRGSIVNMASIAAVIVATVGQVHYNAAKGGLLMLTKGMAAELAPHGIRVNALGPGPIESGHNRPNDEARRERYAQIVPLGRIGYPEDVASAALFLASDEADYITGTILFVDGGWLIQ